MAFEKCNFSQEMEFFKSQLKNAAETFDKMSEFEQVKALDIVKDLFNHLQSSLSRANNDGNQPKLINSDISLIEQDLINCLVVETQQDDILNWNTSNLICEKSSEINNSNCDEEQTKNSLQDLQNVISDESFTSVQLERESSYISVKSAIDQQTQQQNCDNSMANNIPTQNNKETIDENDFSCDTCNPEDNFQSKRSNETKIRRTSQRLANKKNNNKSNDDDNTSDCEQQTNPDKNTTSAAKTKTKKSKRCVKKPNCDKTDDINEQDKSQDTEGSQNTSIESLKANLNCDECKLQFAHQQHYQKHMNGHHRNNCRLCDARFAKRKALCRHLRTVHTITEPEKFYHCPHCDRKFIKRPSLYVHLREHAKGKIVCLKCGLMCDTKELFNTHMLKHTEEAKFHCKKCNESFQRRQQYEQHLTGHDKYNCTLCDINFSTKKHFLKHKRVVHGIQTREEKKHVCFICQKRFQRPMLLEIHMRLHTGEKPIQCTHCDKNFRTPKALAKHMKTAAHLKATGQDENDACEMEKPYLCAQCGTRFYRRQGLVRHTQQLHSDERPFTCPYCDYSCKCKTNLKRHVELHTADRRFVCELCGASFHARATLKEHHAYVHSEDRNFVCSVCGKGFKGRSGLRRHVRIHSDARPYVCYCTQSYKRMSHLKRHMIAIHGALFKSKRVTKIMADENSQSSSCSSVNGPLQSVEQSYDKNDQLLMNVQNAVVDLLQISSRNAENDSMPNAQEFQHLLTPEMQCATNSSLPQSTDQIFASDTNYSHDYPLSSSSSSSSDVTNHFTFCMSLSQSSFGLTQSQLVNPSTQFYQTNDAIGDGLNMDSAREKINSTVPPMFAHS